MSTYSIWLDLEKESRANYRTIISTLSKRLKSPLFEPHCTIYGRLDIKLSDLETIVSKIVNDSNQFSSSVKKLTTGKSYYKSLYVKLENNISLNEVNASCKNYFVNSKKYRFDPHISLAYGQFDLEQIHRVTKGIAIPKYVVFSGVSIVNTKKDVEQWETVFQRKF